jgi:hypothetical protein
MTCCEKFRLAKLITPLASGNPGQESLAPLRAIRKGIRAAGTFFALEFVNNLLSSLLLL